MMSRYHAGIIGLGFIGAADQVSGDQLGQQVVNLDGTHIDAYEKNPRIQVVGGSSRDSGRRERFETRTGTDTYADWKELISKHSLDVVSVATYTPVHREIVEACANAGIRAIYCEKPLAQTIADAQSMVETCRKSGSLLVINHNRRFSPTSRRLRDLIREGLLGEIRSAHLQWGRGRLGNIGTHVFDGIRMLLGREVTAVSGALDESGKPDCRGPQFSDPGGWGLIRFDNGIVATVCAPDYGAQPISMEICGDLGEVNVAGGAVTVCMYDGSTPSWEDLAGDTRGYESASSMDVAVEEIVTWLDKGGAFPYPADEAVAALEVITAFHVSHAQNGAWVELPLTGPDRDIVINSG